MTSPTSSLDTPIDGLRATGTARLPFQNNVLLRSFLLERRAGDVVVYNSPALVSASSGDSGLGAASCLLMNHWHEAMLFGQPDRDLPVYVHERDRVAAARSITVTDTFAGRRMFDETGDIEVIPTPGHTPGTACYLWDNGVHRFLFTGDFIWIEHGEWKAVVLGESSREDYLESMALVRDLEFDVLVPWGVTEGDPCVAVTDRHETRRRVDAIIARVEVGGDR